MSRAYMSENIIFILSFMSIVSFSSLGYFLLNYERDKVVKRLKNIKFAKIINQDDILDKPFYERTIGAAASWLLKTVNKLTPKKAITQIENKLQKAGRPWNMKSNDFIAIEIILGFSMLLATWFVLPKIGFKDFKLFALVVIIPVLAVYIPWFILAKVATQRQKVINRCLPDIMDLLVVSVEAGLAFDIALLKVVEQFRGVASEEFHIALREMQLGKTRKDALKDISNRVESSELTSLVNAIIQSEQLGVGLGSTLRIQSELIRDKRQQQIEEQAMKAPVKMLFPIVFFIFPCIFIIILGPSILNIMKVFGK